MNYFDLGECRFLRARWRILTALWVPVSFSCGLWIKPTSLHSAFLLFAFRATETKKQQVQRSMRVLGIDPGLRNMGWGMIEVDGSRMRHLGNGVCTSEGTDLSLRLLSLHRQLTEVLREYKPDTAAVENTFVNKDGAGTLKLGQARGIALLVPAQAGLDVGEYAPNKVKKTIVGVGHADKIQVQHMVKLQLPGVILNGPDAADALAIAMCHAHYTRSTRIVAQAKRAMNG